MGFPVAPRVMNVLQPALEGANDVETEPGIRKATSWGQRTVTSPSTGGSLSLLGLTKRYGDFTALDDVSFDVSNGEFITVLGPSGSGKSTLLRIIAGFVDPTAGDVRIDGASILRRPPHRRNVGLVFQNYALFPHMSVRDNVAFPLRMRKIGRKDQDIRVAAALDLVQLAELADRFPRQLSGGQQQRVALARTLIFEPRVLLLDEPLGALDKKLREHMQTEIRRIQNKLGVTVFHVTHDQSEALAMSDRIVVMNVGRVAQVGRPEDIYNSPVDSFIAEFIGRGNFLRGKVRNTAIEGTEVELEAGFKMRIARAPKNDVGESVSILIRPEHVKLVAPGDGNLNTTSAVVADRVFIGDAVEIGLVLPNGERIVAKLPVDAETRHPAKGDEVNIGWSAHDCYVVPVTQKST